MTKWINYKRNMEFEDPLTQEEENKYIKLLEEGDSNAREVLITRNLKLVRYIAIRFENTGIEVEELECIGRLGLIKGVDTFKLDKKVRLATYAGTCIQNEIRYFLRGNRKAKLREISMETIVDSYEDGNECTIKEVLPDQSTDFNKIVEGIGNMEDVRRIFECILNDLHGRKKLDILYRLAGYKIKQIAERYHITSRGVTKNVKEIKTILQKRLKNNKKCNCDKYKVAIENNLYKINFTIEETEKYQLCKDIISKTNYQAHYNDLKRDVVVIIDAENEALKLLAQIVECIEDIKIK